MSDFLTEMAAASRARADEARTADLESLVGSAPPAVPLSLSPAGFDVIAEVKLASPSEGRLATGGEEHVIALAHTYGTRGAVAVSVLTEPSRFHGELEHLQAAARHVSVPVMRKDFLVDPVQVLEARGAGASGVLLIARMVPADLLAEMTDLAIELGMFVLVEVFDVTDVDPAAVVFDRDVLVGVNCRDLTTLEVDLDRFETIARHLPEHLPAVAESGMSRPEHLARVASLGYRLALVGTSLMAEDDPAGMLGRFITAGRKESSRVAP